MCLENAIIVANILWNVIVPRAITFFKMPVVLAAPASSVLSTHIYN